MRLFAFSLVPIAIAYNVAHNYSNLLVQGQQLIPLMSDPLGRHWNLFGTADYRANTGIVDAAATWYVAIGAIVAGHVISIWLAHRVALRELGTPGKAVTACIPLTVADADLYGDQPVDHRGADGEIRNTRLGIANPGPLNQR